MVLEEVVIKSINKLNKETKRDLNRPEKIEKYEKAISQTNDLRTLIKDHQFNRLKPQQVLDIMNKIDLSSIENPNEIIPTFFHNYCHKYRKDPNIYKFLSLLDYYPQDAPFPEKIHLLKHFPHLKTIYHSFKTDSSFSVEFDYEYHLEEKDKTICKLKEEIEALFQASHNDPIVVKGNIEEAVNKGNLLAVRSIIENHQISESDLNKKANKLLFDACIKGNLPIVKYLIEDRKFKTTAKDKTNGYNLYHYATFYGHLDIVKYLLEKCNLDKDSRTKDGSNALHIACEKKHNDILKYLVETQELDIESINNKHFTPLHVSCKFNNIAAISYLVKDRNANIEAKTTDDYRPIHIACKEGFLPFVKFLVNNNAKINGKTMEGFTPLLIASKSNTKQSLPIIKFLIQKGASLKSVDNKKYKALHFAAQNGNLDLLKYLIEEKHDEINEQTEEGFTPIYCACLNNQLEAVKYLANQGADISIPDCHGNLPLNIAACKGYDEIFIYFFPPA